MKVNAMLLQKGVHFHPGLEAQQKTCNVPRTNRIRVPMARCGSEIKMTQAHVRLPAGGFRMRLSVTQGLPTER
jgi:hypothetical protein